MAKQMSEHVSSLCQKMRLLNNPGPSRTRNLELMGRAGQGATSWYTTVAIWTRSGYVLPVFCWNANVRCGTREPRSAALQTAHHFQNGNANANGRKLSFCMRVTLDSGKSSCSDHVWSACRTSELHLLSLSTGSVYGGSSQTTVVHRFYSSRTRDAVRRASRSCWWWLSLSLCTFTETQSRFVPPSGSRCCTPAHHRSPDLSDLWPRECCPVQIHAQEGWQAPARTTPWIKV